jgi:hypothetical protein
MEKKTLPLWIQMKHLDESWYSNPGQKYGQFMRMIADRISTELTEVGGDLTERIHTVDDVLDWLIEQAIKGENDVRYNYDWER